MSFNPSSGYAHGLKVAGAILITAGWLAGCASLKPAPGPVSAQLLQASRHAQTGSKLSAQENWEAAAREWKAAADHYSILDRPAETATALHNLAQAQLALEQAEAARQHLQRAAQLNERAGQPGAWWRNQILLLQLEAEENRPKLADHFAVLLAKARSLPDAETRGLFFNEVGLWHSRNGRVEEARRHFKLAEAAFGKSGSTLGRAVVAVNQAMVAEEQGDQAGARAGWGRART